MLKQKFYATDDRIQLEDIWVYRIVQVAQKNGFCKVLLLKLSYSIQERYDVPLFVK